MHTDYQKLSTWIPRLWKEQFAPLFSEGLIVTPFPLIDEILDKLPVDWTDPTLTVLDPCCGSGRFLLAIKYRLLDAGHSEQHIIENMIHGCDVDPVNMTGAVDMLGAKMYNHNIKCANSLTEKWTMKFDVVIGNPPYQAIDRNGTRDNKKDNLWSSFIELAGKLTKVDGCVALITPTSWMSPGSKKKGGSLLETWFLRNQLIHLEVNTAQHYFPGVGSQFSWYVVKHTPYSTPTTIRFFDTKTKTVHETVADLRAFAFLPPTLDSTTLEIFRKTVFAASSALPFKRSTEWATYKKEIKARSRSSRDAQFCYVAFHTTAQMLYFDFPSSTIPVPKVMISLSGYPTPMLDADGNYGITECGLYCDTEPAHTYSVVASRLYQFMLRTAKWSGFNSQWLIQYGLPSVDLTRSWTDAELYAHFNLTQEEIDLIESTVK